MNLVKSIFLVSLSLLFLNLSSAVADENPVVPRGVTYKQVSPALNKESEEKLRAALEKNPPDFLSLMTIVGDKSPSLAGPFVSINDLTPSGLDLSKLTPVQFKIPFTKDFQPIINSYSAVENGQVKILAQAYSNLIKIDPDFQIRKMTPDEMAIVWFYWGFDSLDEPIFIVEDKVHKYLFSFYEDSKTLMFFDDLTKPCYRFGQDNGYRSKCFCTTTVSKDDIYEVRFKQCPEVTEQPAGDSYHDPITGGTYRGDFKTYTPTPAGQTQSAKSPTSKVVLLSTQDELSRNISVKALGDGILEMDKVVADATATETESYNLVVQVTLQPQGKAKIETLAQYGGDYQKIVATIQKINKTISALSLPNTSSDPVKFQVIYPVGGTAH